MNVVEHSVDFAAAGCTLVGIVSMPGTAPMPDAGSAIGVVVIVGGPQYRAGSHRQFVLLARRLAAAGFPTLRFDHRGMGDSEGDAPGFEHLQPDIAAACDTLQRACPAVRRIVLWGLCDGASAALLYWQTTRDDRIAGLCVANPWVRNESGAAKVRVKHYYVDRLRSADFWAKLMRGGIGWRAARELASSVGQSVATASEGNRFQDRMAAAWQAFPGPMLLLLSGRDYTAKEFLGCVADDPAWSGALQRRGVVRHDIHDADHTFSGAAHRAAAESATAHWLRTHVEATAAEAARCPPVPS